jgi:acyl-CoA synthetase (AMP-forming)/AMP-acid ligase II
MLLQDRNWVDCSRRQAERWGTKPAYIFLDGSNTAVDTLTFGEVDARARALAGYLQKLCAPGDRVLLLYPSCNEYIVAFFACLYAGLIAVPVFAPRSSRHGSRLDAISANAGAKLALTTQRYFTASVSSDSSQATVGGLRWVATDVLVLDVSDWNPVRIHDTDIAFLQYTSGSTGSPKGVMVSHANLLSNESMIAEAFSTTPASTYVTWLPLYHDMGLIGNILHAFWAGATCVFMSPLDFLQQPVRWLQAISDYKAHISGGPNFAYDLCVQKVRPEVLETIDLGSWRVAFNGAEPVRHSTLEQFHQRFSICNFAKSALHPCYGMAESTLVISGGQPEVSPKTLWLDKLQIGNNVAVDKSPDDLEARPFVSCGRRLGSETIRIVNPESLDACPDNIIGEIWASGEHIAQGYWQLPEETAAVFADRLAGFGDMSFLRTGDLGFMRDGELYITGRLKDVLIVRGCNYYPQDIEGTVEAAHPAIRRSAVAAFSVTDSLEEQVVVIAEIERTQMRTVQVPDLLRAIRARVIEEHGLPLKDVVFLRPGTLSRTTSGKVRRRHCRTLYLSDQLEQIA